MALYEEKTIRARKPHKCIGCLTGIASGESYLRIKCSYDDGTPCSIAYHPDCRAWEVELCQSCDLNSDEWIELHEHVTEGGLCMLKGAPQPVRDRFAKSIRAERQAEYLAYAAAHS